jgi:iron complex transport system ATP-binding protein
LYEIEVKGLEYSYDGMNKKALNNVNFSIRKGEFIGIIGPNGSGKTTLVKTLTSILPYSGSVKVRGKEVKDYSKKELAQLVGVASQEFTPAYDMKAKEIVEMGRIPYTGIFGNLSSNDEKIVRQAFKILGIENLMERMFYSLSGGERQMVYAAKVLAQDPQILVLDETTAHLDIGHVETLLTKILKAFQRNGRTVLATFHDINQAIMFSDRLIILKDGKIFAQGSPCEILSEELIYEVYSASCSLVRHPKNGKISVLIDLEDGRSSFQFQDTVSLLGNSQRVWK